MTAKKRSKTTQSTEGTGSKKTATPRSRNSRQKTAGKTQPNSLTQTGVSIKPSETAKATPAPASAAAQSSPESPPAQSPPAQPPRKPQASRSADMAEQQSGAVHSGIDAMEVMKQAQADNAAAPGQKEQAKHVSAAQAIAKAIVRDHSDTAQPPRKPVIPEKKPALQSAPTPAPDLPEEPKEPIGGVGAKGLPPPVVDTRDVEALLNADHADPFAFLGMHKAAAKGTLAVRAFLPDATGVDLLDPSGAEPILHLGKVHDEGLFVGTVQGRTQPFPYRLRVTTAKGTVDIEDPYRFPPVLSDADARKLSKFEDLSSYQFLGAHPAKMDGVEGVTFAVWAPNASHVALVGDFNNWDGRRHGMRHRHECGAWEIFMPGLGSGDLYKYEIKTAPGTRPMVKSDPYAFGTEHPPGTASVVRDIRQYRWNDSAWIKQRGRAQDPGAPLSFYEVHLGSWRRKPEEGDRWLTYRELAGELVSYVSDLGFTHISLLPVSEHSFDDTVGYLPSALFSPTSRYGTPDDFRYLVDTCHRAGIGVVADWVPNFLSTEPHGLIQFDGSPLYEDTRPHHNRDLDWDMPLYNLGSPAVVNYLLSNALYWLDQFHLDGLRIDSLAKLLFLDFGRGEGEWTPNRDGGNECLEALDFIRRLNKTVLERFPGVLTIAEDSSLRQGVTKSVEDQGLGFKLRWNSAWAYDTLRYLGRHPVHRKYYQHELINPLNHAFDEQFVLPISHDHVSIGQGAMVNKLPGDEWQRFATLRAWLGMMYALPGKKLLFMGTEFAQDREWNSNISLDWHLLQNPAHLGIQRLIRDFNKLIRDTPALHELDSNPNGFEWIDTNDDDCSVVSYCRYGKDRSELVVAVTHFTPVVRPNYRIGVPEPGYYREVLNTDAEIYGGGNWGSEGGARAEQHAIHGREHSMCITLPPYATVVLKLVRRD